MIRSFFIINICVICVPSFSQNNLDSLWSVYNNKSQPDTARLKAIHDIAWSYRTNNPDSAILLAGKELQLAKQNKQKIYTANALNTVGVSLISKGEYPKAMEHISEALKIYEEIGDKRGIGNCYVNSGYIGELQSNYPKALQNYLKGLKNYEDIKYKKGIFNCYNNIGNIYYNQFDNSKALEYYEKGLKICEETGNRYGVATCYHNFGLIYSEMSVPDMPKALENLERSLKIYEEIENKRGMANCYRLMAGIYSDLSDHKKGLAYYFRELKFRKESEDIEGMGVCYANLARVYNLASDFKRSIKYSDSSLKIAIEVGSYDDERMAYRNLARAYGNINNFKKAYEYHVKFKELTDSIFNVDNSKQLGDMKTQFEVEKKEAELKIKAEAQEAISAEEKKKQQIIIYSVAGVLLLVIVFSLFLFNRFRITQKQKKVIEEQKVLVDTAYETLHEKNKEVLDSIYYARRIQRALITSEKSVDNQLKKLMKK